VTWGPWGSWGPPGRGVRGVLAPALVRHDCIRFGSQIDNFWMLMPQYKLILIAFTFSCGRYGYYLRQRRRYMFLPVFVCLSFLSVCLLARLLKNACMDLDEMLRVDSGGTWTNWLTFEPDPDHSPDAGTGLFSPISYKRATTRNFIGKISRIFIGRPSLQRGVVLKWFYSPRAIIWRSVSLISLIPFCYY